LQEISALLIFISHKNADIDIDDTPGYMIKKKRKVKLSFKSYLPILVLDW